MKKDKTPVKVSVLKVIYKSIIPSYYRLKSLAEYANSPSVIISEIELAGLLEATSCAMTLKQMFEEYLAEAKEHSVQVLHLSNFEFQSLIEMSKVVEAAQRVSFMNTNIRSH